MGGRGSSSMSSRTGSGGRVQKHHLRGSEIPDTPEKTAAYLGVSVEQAKEMYDAVQSWSGSLYTDIREYQRTGQGGQYVKDKEKALEAYIDAAPKWDGGATYRGMRLPQSVIDTYVPGAQVNMGGSASWSTDRGVAEGFATGATGGKKPVVVRCKTNKNGTSIRHFSYYKKEDEVLVSKKAWYNVTSTKVVNGITYVYVEEV